jgi:hypothetical protein
MTQTWWSVARYALTIALAALTAAYGYYPSVHWLPIAIATLGTLGIHVVPTTAPMYKMTVSPQLAPLPPGTYSTGVSNPASIKSTP